MNTARSDQKLSRLTCKLGIQIRNSHRYSSKNGWSKKQVRESADDFQVMMSNYSTFFKLQQLFLSVYGVFYC
ncbi:hypothetical protein EYC84_006512 [Monilinia fructicola]|uniref:Uncharacterized protein n=1 Tax=Monilinia fructicola TaxID=38448 RepID=A0A5M9K461_MONFR|nr:hypothetical protein EYC84_006512 [Monilinia fructicola]